ncbi:MAG TPA: lysophospholipid acyltransferase family protein [Candidatus Rifleibacterium sp.]|nr:lysophospholipid acyltransferase family protein [Candidatus Rifleibacterium sp.]HPT44422.1 lysophospholipid acyltransferase family protein [Candidatus Rifleibacterium sp.]
MTGSLALFNRVQLLLLDGLARCCADMSHRRKHRLARLIATLARPLPWLRFSQVCSSLREHLEIDQPQAAKLAMKIFESFLVNAFEMAGLKYYSPEQLIARADISGLENLKTALAAKKGAIIVSGHFGLWEIIPPWLALHGFNVTTVVRRQNNRFVDAWFEDMRQRHGARTTDSGYGIRDILKSLRQGHILALMVDQDNGKQGIFVKFFKRWASAPTGPALISLKTGAPIVPVAIFPDYERQHKIKIWPAIFPGQFSNDLAGQQKLTASFTAILEEIVKKQPEQWFWLHRRWKTQPADAPENPWAKLVLTTTHAAGDNSSEGISWEKST